MLGPKLQTSNGVILKFDLSRIPKGRKAITHCTGVSSGFIFPGLLPEKVTDGCIKTNSIYVTYTLYMLPTVRGAIILIIWATLEHGDQGKGGFLLTNKTKETQVSQCLLKHLLYTGPFSVRASL